MRIFTHEDCDQTGFGFSLKNKVVVLPQSVLPEDHPGQLFFCTGGNGANPNPIGRSVFLVSLSTGEQCRFLRGDVMGTLKPELLPDGRYAAGVWLCSPQEVMGYMEMQKPYQYRVLICDRDDFAVMEVVKGELVYPSQEELEAFRQGQKNGGMTMT